MQLLNDEELNLADKRTQAIQRIKFIIKDTTQFLYENHKDWITVNSIIEALGDLV